MRFARRELLREKADRVHESLAGRTLPDSADESRCQNPVLPGGLQEKRGSWAKARLVSYLLTLDSLDQLPSLLASFGCLFAERFIAPQGRAGIF